MPSNETSLAWRNCFSQWYFFLNDLVKKSLLKNKAYEQLEDTDKAEILKDLYYYGTAIAKAEASTSYLLPSEIQKIKDSGMSPEEYILLKYISNLGGTKKDDMYNSLISAGYSQKDTQEFLTDYKGYK